MGPKRMEHKAERKARSPLGVSASGDSGDSTENQMFEDHTKFSRYIRSIESIIEKIENDYQLEKTKVEAVKA